MTILRRYLCVWMLIVLPLVRAQSRSTLPEPAYSSDPGQLLLVLANQSRASVGAGPLQWDPALAAGAREHCLRMSVAGPLSHRYDGEPDLTARAAAAGAHFSLIEENIAVGDSAVQIHQAWLRSPGHRSNLLNPAVDRVGIAVIVRQGLLYAVADYARAAPVLTREQVEAQFARLLRAHHLEILRDSREARAACAYDGNYRGMNPPQLLMRWQNPDVTRLPDAMVAALERGAYHAAAIGSCPARDLNGGFTAYRVAVLLY